MESRLGVASLGVMLERGRQAVGLQTRRVGSLEGVTADLHPHPSQTTVTGSLYNNQGELGGREELCEALQQAY